MITVHAKQYFCSLLMFMSLSAPALSAPAGYPVDMDEIVSLLRSPEASGRVRGIAAASSLGPKAKAAIPDLVRLLEEGDERVRIQTLFALGNIAPDSDSVIPELINRLADPSETVRSYASSALAKSGKAAVPGIMRTASGPKAEARIAAIHALGMVRPVEEGVIPLLVKFLAKEPEHASARNALCAIGEAAIPELKKAAGASDASLRLRAIETFSCMQTKPADFAPEIVKALHDPDREVRKAAIAALPKLGPEAGAAAPALIEGLRDPAPEMKAAVLRAMLSVGKGLEGAIPDLIKNLASSDKEIRMYSARVLGSIGPAAMSAVPALRTARRDPDVFVGQAAEAALSRIRYVAGASSSDQASAKPKKINSAAQKTGGTFYVTAPVGVFDKAAPVVTVESAARFAKNGKTYFSGKVPVSVNAEDIGGKDATAGVAMTYFLVDEPDPVACLRKSHSQSAQPGTCSNPAYRGPILLPEGVHKLHYWGVDKAGNTSKITGMEVFVDGTPPTADLVINGKSILPGATIYAEPGDRISIVSADPVSNRVSSGLKNVHLLIDISLEECSYADLTGGIDGMGSCENPIYSKPFQLPEGEHVIHYRTEDNLGNVGELQTVSVIVRDRGR